MRAQDLIDAAQLLATAQRGRPRQAFLRRAVSSAYYALFHTLARCCADCLIGGSNAERSDPAWRQVYRSLDHGFARNQCRDPRIARFPQSIQDFANVFATLQIKRHQADYDPSEVFERSAVALDIEQIRSAIASFQSTPLKDRRAFAAFVLLKSRRD